MNNLEQLDHDYFWVLRPRVVINELERYFDSVCNVTYINDGVPSLAINGIYTLYLPNSIRTNPDTQEYNYYMIVDDYSETPHDSIPIECATLDRAIDELKELFEKITLS
jgi:hypothetical protein